MLELLISFLKTSSLTNIFMIFIIENLVIFILAILVGQVIIKLFYKKMINVNTFPNTQNELLLACMTIFLNSVITFIGLLLWRYELINFTNKTILQSLIDTVLLLLLMDIAMYFFHRIAHNKFIFDRIHKLHHKYTNPNPLTLFILSPSEALGFGSLWLFLLFIHDWSWLGMSLYLALNVAFGTIGHLGVEPFPKIWVKLPLIKYISTSTFHFQHHSDKDYNYGFYTTIWDKIFGTLKFDYQENFIENSSVKKSNI